MNIYIYTGLPAPAAARSSRTQLHATPNLPTEIIPIRIISSIDIIIIIIIIIIIASPPQPARHRPS